MLSNLIKYIPSFFHTNDLLSITSFIKSNSILVLLLFASLFFSNGYVYAERDELTGYNETSSAIKDNNASAVLKETSKQMVNNSMNFEASYHLSDLTQFVLSADLGNKSDYEYSDVNDIAAGGTLTANHKFGKEKSTAWTRARISTAYIDSQNNSGDGQTYSLAFQIGGRFNERADLKISYTYDYKESSNSPVFEQQGHKGSADMNLIVNENTLLTLGYTVHDGDIPSTDYRWVTPSDYIASEAIESNYLFPAGLYSMQGTTHIFEIDLNHDFLQNTASFNLGYQYKNEQYSQFNYSTNILLASLNYKY